MKLFDGKMGAREFMLMHLHNEEKELRQDMRKIRKGLSKIDGMKAQVRRTSVEDLEAVINKEPEVAAQYEKAKKLANMTYEEYEQFMEQEEAKNEV